MADRMYNITDRMYNIKNNELIIANYAISIIVFIIALIFVDDILSAVNVDVEGKALLVVGMASATAGFVGGLVTRQHIPFKDVGVIILVAMTVSVVLLFMVFLGGQQLSYAVFSVVYVLVFLIYLIGYLSIILLLHAEFSYFGVRIRQLIHDRTAQ